MAVKIEIIDPSSVLLDGVNAGQALDAVRNHPQEASNIQRALSKWWADKEREHNERTQSIAIAKDKETSAVLAKETQSHKKEVDELTAKLNQKQTEIDALGGTEVGKRMAKEKAIAEARKVKEDAERKIKELEGVS